MRSPFAKFMVAAILLGVAKADTGPLRLHPDNPHYFEFQGRPTVLITATEHYGAVINLDFDFVAYLDELKVRGFNLTRVFSGAYREIPGSFGIRENTLAPKAGRFAAPWARSSIPGASDGGNKFDLSRWDDAYFARLKDFVRAAGQRGVVVEFVFFCTFYSEELWRSSPLHGANNVNGIGCCGPYEVYSLNERLLQEAQEALVRKVVTELKEAPNLYYEVCNEPYERGGLTRAWNDAIVAAIFDTEAGFPKRHLIAQGFGRDPPKIREPNPQVSVLNFHAATPECASLNYALRRPLADDETGGKGIADLPYRSEAWEFMLAGGAVVDHLDFSFTPADPNGNHRLTDEPGGGGPGLRRQLQILKQFLESFAFVRMKPDGATVRPVGAPRSAKKPLRAQTLAERGRVYAIYVSGGGPCDVTLELPANRYRAEWINTTSGEVMKNESFEHPGGEKRMTSPNYDEDIALGIRGAPGS